MRSGLRGHCGGLFFQSRGCRDAGPAGAAEGRAGFGTALLLFGLAAGSALAADTPGEKLKAVQEEIESRTRDRTTYAAMAEKFTGEIAALQAETVEAAKATQADEARMTELEAELQRLVQDQKSKTEALERRRAQDEALLTALGRLASNPPEAMILRPGEPIDMLRGGRLLGSALPRIEAEARTLREDVAELAQLQARIDAKTRELLAHRDGLAQRQAALSALIIRKSELRKGAETNAQISARRLAKLSGEAHDLRDLIARIEKENQEEARRLAALARVAPPRPAQPAGDPPLPQPPQSGAPARLVPPHASAPSLPETEGSSPPQPQPAGQAVPLSPGMLKGIRSFASARGAMILPAGGRLVRRFGDPGETGSASRGIQIETRPGAEVVAPFDGRVEFAGPFRGYDQILILAHGDGYHSLLAGLQRIDAAVGQWLVRGEPVGVTRSDGRQTILNMELWRHGQPIDPLPRLGQKEGGTSG